MFCSWWYLYSMIYSSPLASVDEFAHLCGLWWKVTNEIHLTLVNGDCIIYQNLRTSKWWNNDDWTWSISQKRSIKKEAFGKWYFDLPSVVMTSFSGVQAGVWSFGLTVLTAQQHGLSKSMDATCPCFLLSGCFRHCIDTYNILQKTSCLMDSGF